MLNDLLIIVFVFLSAFILGFSAARVYIKKTLQTLSEELMSKNKKIEDLDLSLRVAKTEISGLKTDLKGSVTQEVYEELKKIHKQELDKIDKWIKEQKTQIKTLHKQLETADKARMSLEDKHANQNQELAELQEKLEHTISRMQLAEERLNTAFDDEHELPNLQEVIFEREQEIAELRGKIEELEEIISDDNLSQDYGFKNMANFLNLESQLGTIKEEKTERIAPEADDTKEEDLATKAANDPNFPREKLDIEVVNADYAKEIDDLTQLKGIGEYTALKLNAVGIQNLKQISNLTEEDIKKVNTAIKFFPGRIKRDKWVNQAKEILKNREGN